MARAENMRRLLAPRSIVFIGGSNLIQPIRNCRKIGYEGEIWVVNPKYDEIDGITCYASLEDLPGIPDAAFVAVRVDVTVEIVRQLALLGCGGCVCYAAGFAEVGRLRSPVAGAAGNRCRRDGSGRPQLLWTAEFHQRRSSMARPHGGWPC